MNSIIVSGLFVLWASESVAAGAAEGESLSGQTRGHCFEEEFFDELNAKSEELTQERKKQAEERAMAAEAPAEHAPCEGVEHGFADFDDFCRRDGMDERPDASGSEPASPAPTEPYPEEEPEFRIQDVVPLRSTTSLSSEKAEALAVARAEADSAKIIAGSSYPECETRSAAPDEDSEEEGRKFCTDLFGSSLDSLDECEKSEQESVRGVRGPEAPEEEEEESEEESGLCSQSEAPEEEEEEKAEGGAKTKEEEQQNAEYAAFLKARELEAEVTADNARRQAKLNKQQVEVELREAPKSCLKSRWSCLKKAPQVKSCLKKQKPDQPMFGSEVSEEGVRDLVELLDGAHDAPSVSFKEVQK